MSEPLLQLAYVSQATRPLDEVALLEILNQSRIHNQRVGITGFLMHTDGNFFQVIEGTPVHIDTLWAKLMRDTRHHAVTRVLYRPIDERMFAGWSMAFHSTALQECDALPGYSAFLNHYLDMDVSVPGARKAFAEEDVMDIIMSLKTKFLRH